MSVEALSAGLEEANHLELELKKVVSNHVIAEPSKPGPLPEQPML